LLGNGVRKERGEGKKKGNEKRKKEEEGADADHSLSLAYVNSSAVNRSKRGGGKRGREVLLRGER